MSVFLSVFFFHILFTSSNTRRPDSSFLWLLNPMKTLKFIIWKNYKWLILKIVLLTCLSIFLALFIYAMPTATVHKLFGFWRLHICHVASFLRRCDTLWPCGVSTCKHTMKCVPVMGLIAFSISPLLIQRLVCDTKQVEMRLWFHQWRSFFLKLIKWLHTK